MLRMFRNSAAVIAATVALGTPLMAQTAPVAGAAPDQAAATAPAQAQGTLPEALSKLGITDAKLDTARRGGQRAEGTLPGGAQFQAMLDDKGELRMIRVTDKAAALPAEIIAQLVPANVSASPMISEFAKLQGLGTGEKGVMLFGVDAKDEPVRAAFAPDGVLKQFGRGDFAGPGKDGRGRGDHGPGDGDRKDRKGHHGKKGDHGDHKKGDRRDRGNDGPDGPRGPGAAAPALDDAGVQSILNDGGYTQIGAIRRDGPRIEADATNPEGEAVTVTVNPRGVVVRELAR